MNMWWIFGSLGAVLLVGAAFLLIYNDPVRCRRRYRKTIAEAVLKYADALEGHQLFVGVPFPPLVVDPKAPPEDWSDRPRSWARVLGRDGDMLLLAGHAARGAHGCEWYVYCDAHGNGVAWAAPLEELPQGVDRESIFPSDVLLGGGPDEDTFFDSSSRSGSA